MYLKKNINRKKQNSLQIVSEESHRNIQSQIILTNNSVKAKKGETAGLQLLFKPQKAKLHDISENKITKKVLLDPKDYQKEVPNEKSKRETLLKDGRSVIEELSRQQIISEQIEATSSASIPISNNNSRKGGDRSKIMIDRKGSSKLLVQSDMMIIQMLG